jgi:hypothetical protein
MKLYELEDKMPLPLRVNTDKGLEEATCHHLDGMYSYCHLDAEPNQIFHLSCGTPMKEVDGRWEIDE